MDPPGSIVRGERLRRGRRWWLVFAALFAMVIGGLLRWRTRPLNAVERRLVGIWSVPSVDEEGSYLVFGADRQLTYGTGLFDPTRRDGGLELSLTGSWRATESSMVGRWGTGLLSRLRNLWEGGTDSFEMEIRFAGPDKLQIVDKDGRKVSWMRVSDKPVAVDQK